MIARIPYAKATRFLTDTADSPEGFRPSVTIAEVGVTKVSGRKVTRPLVGFGAHVDRTYAEMIAKAELAERLVLFSMPLANSSSGLLRDSPRRVDPRTLLQLSSARLRHFRLAPFSSSTPYCWVPAREVVSASSAEVVADMCYAVLPSFCKQRLAWANSSGMAAHSSFELASKAALLKLFERDALMVTWMARHTPPHVPTARLPSTLRRCMAQISALGYTCVSLDLTCRKVPVAAALVYRDRVPALIVTVAARFSLREALEAAWKEMEVEVFWRLQHATNDSIPMKTVTLHEHHAQFYDQPGNLPIASFLWQHPKKTTSSLDRVVFSGQGTFDIQACAKCLGIDKLYTVDYGDVFGLCVARVLSPNLVPLLFGWNQFPLTHSARGSARLSGDVRSAWPNAPIPPHPFC